METANGDRNKSADVAHSTGPKARDSGVNFERSISNSGQDVVNGPPATFVKHYSDPNFDPKFSDIADSDLASFARTR
jgi:hypothetical protein